MVNPGSPVQVTVCSDHFISGNKSDLPGSADFIPSVQTKELKLPGCSIHGEDCYCRFEHVRCHAGMQELQSKELDKNRRGVELEQAQ